MKKTNPRRRPATQADVNKARKQATDQGVAAATAIVMFVLREKFGFGKVRLTRFWNEVNSLAEDVSSGEVKLDDIMDVLRDEYDIEIR